MSQDLGSILKAWDYNPQRVTARWVEGDDAKLKVQLRVDLGIFQMELQDRPDGLRPHGCASLLHHYLLLEQTAPPDTPKLRLNEPACAALQQEMLQYYYRYTALFALRHYDGVIRDTEHNLRIIEFLGRHALAEPGQIALTFYPHVRLMKARACAEKALAARQFAEAGAALECAREDIETFAARHELPEPVLAPVRATLRELTDGLRQRQPRSPVDRLREELDQAVAAENFERAALLRDRLRALATADHADGAAAL